MGDGLLAALGIGFSEADAKAAADRLVANGFSDFIARAPKIEPYFQRRKESVDRYLEEVVTSVNAHEEQIAQDLLGGKRPTRVLSLKQASFSYRGARSVLIITTDAGKFLYKPHPMRYSTVFHELCESLLPGKAHVPRTIECGNACLCEFVESISPAHEQERDAYYEGLGGYLALAYFISLTDQHAENVLPFGPKFAPIDIETLFMASPAFKGSASYRDDPALCIRGSIASTGMLSYGHDRLIGSIVAGTSGKGISPIRTSTEAIDHLDVIANGFCATYRKCLRSKQTICGAIRSLADVDLRLLMAPGSFYQGLHAGFFELDGWDEATRLQELDSILRSTRFRRTNDAVYQHERAILIGYDIPYFTVKADGLDLLGDGEVIWPDYLSQTPMETAIRHVEDADESDLAWQLELLRKLVVGMPLMSKTRVADIKSQCEPLTKDEALEEAGLILHRLFDELVDCGQGRHAIMAFSNADDNYGPMDSSLGWGYAGVAVFVAACRSLVAGDVELALKLEDLCVNELARNGRYLRMSPEILSTAEALNFKTGLAGQLRALQLMWSASRDDKIRETYAELLSLLDLLDFSTFSEPAALDALGELSYVLAHAAPELPKCPCSDSLTNAVAPQATKAEGGEFSHDDASADTGTNAETPALQNRDDLSGGNAGTVEQLIISGQHATAGKFLAAIVARRRETGDYIYKGAWRKPYFDPALFHGATGIGYELLRYADPKTIAPIFA